MSLQGFKLMLDLVFKLFYLAKSLVQSAAVPKCSPKVKLYGVKIHLTFCNT